MKKNLTNKKPAKKKHLTEEEKFQKEMNELDDEDFDVTARERVAKPSMVVVVDNGYDIILRDLSTGFLYAVEKSKVGYGISYSLNQLEILEYY